MTTDVEFVTIEGESLEDRARRLLLALLPHLESRDQALAHLFYIYPDVNERSRLWSIAAALFFLDRSRLSWREWLSFVFAGNQPEALAMDDEHFKAHICEIVDRPMLGARRLQAELDRLRSGIEKIECPHCGRPFNIAVVEHVEGRA